MLSCYYYHLGPDRPTFSGQSMSWCTLWRNWLAVWAVGGSQASPSTRRWSRL